MAELGGEQAPQASINAQLGRDDDDPHTDGVLAALAQAGYISGPEVEDLGGPVFCGLTEKGRQEVSGWPRATAGAPSIAITNSTVGQLAMGDINNLTPAAFFDAWEEQLEASVASEAEKEEARGALRRSKEMVTQTTTGAAGGLLAGALRAVLGF